MQIKYRIFAPLFKPLHLVIKQLDSYTLDFNVMPFGREIKHYHLDDAFFEAVDSPLLDLGNVEVELIITKGEHHVLLEYQIEGYVQVPCDRCLDLIQMPVKLKDEQLIKFGRAYLEEDDFITIDERLMQYNVAWMFFEAIDLSLPLVRVHPKGDCNPEMLAKLEELCVTDESVLDSELDDVTDGTDFNEASSHNETESKKQRVDPRWAALKNMLGDSSSEDEA